LTFFILWYQARKAKAASCLELTELLKKKTAAEDEAARARKAAARERDGFAREKAKMEEQAQEERDSMAREKEKCGIELRAAARQNRKMATALLQVPYSWQKVCVFPVLRICDLLVRIRILGSESLTN
jgi:hypothetical protein